MILNIIVCVKRVPDTETRIRMANGDKEIDPAGVKYVMSPYDEFALEAALRMKEESGEGEVTVLTLGEDSSQEILRGGLAVGADSAVLLKGPVTMDGLATAKALAAELQNRDAPLVIFGVKAVDDDQQQVGPMVATILERPCASNVTGFELVDDKLRCRREVEGGTEIIELKLPAVVSITKGDFEPRYASLKGIMAAKKKPLEQIEASISESSLIVERLDYPPVRTPGRIVGEGVDAVPELVRILREESNVI
tara:strand:+ start:2023 stop:2778 length:756 start_codon:yes stop_codon:yes gene_type:complete